MPNALLEHYKKNVVAALKTELGFSNLHQVPRLQKIVLNSCVGSAAERSQALEDAVKEMSQITGQKPVITKSKKSISNFKLRELQDIGCKVTLRGQYMWEFLQRLIVTALPRVRDFRGISARGFDGRGNYTLGISDQTIFPEIELDKVRRTLGFDVTICTTANSDKEALALLKKLGMPFRESGKSAAANESESAAA